jgi:hypothetical protein
MTTEAFRPWIPLLLADPSPSLRFLVLRELLDRADGEVDELIELRERDPLVAPLLEAQSPDGSWGETHSGRGGSLRATWLALMRLGYMGLGPDVPAVRRGAVYLFSQQLQDGSWPLPGDDAEEHVYSGGRSPGAREGYSMIPLQTAMPLRALALCGYATDPRAERAYEWLLVQRLADGAWPTGIASGTYGYVAGYRRLAHSRWGCRSNTTGCLICLASHPTRRTSSAARRALDLLLGRETRERRWLGFEVARLIGAEPARGFLTFFARFDLALVLDLCWRVGISLEDQRVAELAKFILGEQGPYGLWEYAAHPEASRWVTWDLLRSFSQLHAEDGWVGLEPRTPFQAYSRKPRRF